MNASTASMSMRYAFTGTAVADIVGPAGDGNCAGATLVRAGHPFVIADCVAAGYRGTCDPDYRNARTLTVDGTRQPALAVAGSTPSPVQVGQTVAILNIGHSDLGQTGQANTATRNHENVVLQNADFRAVDSQPFLYSTDNYPTPTTGSQSGNIFTADPVSITSDSYNSTTKLTTLAYTGMTVASYSVSSGTSALGGVVGQGQNGSMVAGCATSCTSTGSGTFQTTSFTRVLLAGDRIVIPGEPGVWRVDAVPDDATLTISSLTGMTSTAVSGANISKVGAALHFTSGALAGQEFPLADGNQPSGGNVVVGDASAAVAGDSAYVNPGWQYGQAVHWWNCVGNSTGNDTWSAVLATPTGATATLTHPLTCGPGSNWYRGTGNIGFLYMGSVIATNVNQATNLAIFGQVSGTALGWALIDTTYFGTSIYQRNAIATSTTTNGYSVDLSGVFDSIVYSNDNSNANESVVYDAGAPLVPQINWNLDNDAFFGHTALSYGSANSQASTFGTMQLDLGFGAATFKPNFNGTSGLTQKKKGVRGNPNRPDGCPIYPVSAGALLSCSAPSFVGARQP